MVHNSCSNHNGSDVYAYVHNEQLPDGDRRVISEEGVHVMFVGHVAVITQVKVITYGTLPTKTTQTLHTTRVASDVHVTDT